MARAVRGLPVGGGGDGSGAFLGLYVMLYPQPPKLSNASHDAHFARPTGWGSVYFTLTLSTSIGFGNFTPLTSSGKVVATLYSVLALPLLTHCILTVAVPLESFRELVRSYRVRLQAINSVDGDRHPQFA